MSVVTGDFARMVIVVTNYHRKDVVNSEIVDYVLCGPSRS